MLNNVKIMLFWSESRNTLKLFITFKNGCQCEISQEWSSVREICNQHTHVCLNRWQPMDALLLLLLKTFTVWKSVISACPGTNTIKLILKKHSLLLDFDALFEWLSDVNPVLMCSCYKGSIIRTSNWKCKVTSTNSNHGSKSSCNVTAKSV